MAPKKSRTVKSKKSSTSPAHHSSRNLKHSCSKTDEARETLGEQSKPSYFENEQNDPDMPQLRTTSDDSLPVMKSESNITSNNSNRNLKPNSGVDERDCLTVGKHTSLHSSGWFSALGDIPSVPSSPAPALPPHEQIAHHESQVQILEEYLKLASIPISNLSQDLSLSTLIASFEKSTELPDNSQELYTQSVIRNYGYQNTTVNEKKFVDGRIQPQMDLVRLQGLETDGNSLSLDPFNNALDQTSEVQIKSTGQASVDTINDALDNLLSNILEDASRIAEAGADKLDSFWDNHDYDDHHPIYSCLALPGLSERIRGYLLDALLHDEIVKVTYSLFFSTVVAPVLKMDCTPTLEALFDKLAKNEPWMVSQRWRAITAAALAQEPIDTAILQDSAHKIINAIAIVLGRAYRVTSSVFESALVAHAFYDIITLLSDAYTLSIAIKRDIISVRLAVTCAPEALSPFDPSNVKSVWPEMGAKSGDAVIGTYNFGLTRQTESGEAVHLLQPKVITSALLNYSIRQLDQ